MLESVGFSCTATGSSFASRCTENSSLEAGREIPSSCSDPEVSLLGPLLKNFVLIQMMKEKVLQESVSGKKVNSELRSNRLYSNKKTHILGSSRGAEREII